MNAARMILRAGYTKRVEGLRKLELSRIGGATFRLTAVYEDGTTEKLMEDTSGKLDSLTVEITRGIPDTIEVAVAGKGVQRGGAR